ncbi:papain like cysteine protease AvrRpt2 [Rhizobium sp. PP-CC-2G-626]|nr:papain like cysteine protease AvrRpt2 [Rhizobium sp. PP-CC-2G-626]
MKKIHPRGGSIRFSIEKQQQTNWCWAAVSVSVARFFDPSSSVRQCDVVTEALGTDACSATACMSSLNKTWYLDRALALVFCFQQMVNTSVAPGVVRGIINKRLPLCIRIGWQGGGGHFMVIRGWFEDGHSSTTYVVEDPKKTGRLTRRMSADRALAKMNGCGTWTHTYFVTDPALGGGGPGTMSHDPEALGG